ncbi:MAG: hypothetical protein UT32_C0029G0008 [Parcubacteria group bacterium GW2011_GWC2_39_14]|nr:MAG: hypothetical protein UT32_C0029G0008 [Parcubacteria group bacterium GW2011_GWC2_39_14]
MIDQNYQTLFSIYAIGILSTLSITSIFSFVFFKKNLLINWSKYLFIFSILFYFTYILTFQFLKLYTFKYYADFSVWLELFSNIKDGRGIISTLEQTSHSFETAKNYLAIHFVPLIYLLVLPLYIFKNYPVYLIVLQTLILTSSIIPIYLFARDVFKDKRIGHLFAASFLFFPTLQYINLYDFEFLRISIPLLLFCFYFLNTKKYFLYYTLFVLSILVREEVALITFLLGLHITFIMKEKNHGIITSVISVVYFLVLVKIIMPHFAGDMSGFHYHKAFDSFSYLGDSPVQILIYIISHPLAIFSNLLDKVKIANFLMYIIPLLFTSFFSPSILLISTSNLLLNFLSVSISHYSYILYYLSPSIPFLFLSAIQGVKNISDKGLPYLKKKTILLSRFDSKECTYVLVSCIFVACASSSIFFGPSPLSIQFWNKNYKLAPYKTHNFHYSQYILTDHHKKVFAFLSLIPNDVTVSAEHFFLPYLYKKKTLMQFPIFKEADYVLIDKKHPIKFGVSKAGVDPLEARSNPQQYYDLVEKDTKNWELIKEDDGIFLFKRLTW